MQHHPRILALDGIRAVAATTVLASHIGEAALPDGHALWQPLGHLGVVLFFFTSGYLIPAARMRATTGAFLIRRVCRIYPLYWVSLALAVLWYWQGWVVPAGGYTGAPDQETRAVVLGSPGAAIAWHVPLLQFYAGVPHLLGVYWTLWIEELFYLLVALLGRIGWLQRPRAVAAALVAWSLFLDAATPLPLGMYLCLLWAGYLIWRRQQSTAPIPLSWVALLIAVGLLPHSDEFGWGAMLMRPVGLILFLVALRARPTGWAVALGQRTYAIYLLHPLIIAAWFRLPPPWSVAAWLAGTLVVAVVAERWIERPGIALGRRLSAPSHQPRYQRPPGDLPLVGAVDAPADARR